MDFYKYVKAEIIAIAKFRKKESQKQNRKLSHNEAVKLWIETLRAEEFHKKHWENI